jgi:arginine N-succinyltransferase
VLGQAHPDSRPAQRLLEQEGFRYQQYVDIFDGGPAVEAPRAEIRSVRKSVCASARVQDTLDPSMPLHLLANTRLGGFRCVIAPAGLEAGAITLAADAARALQIGSGDALRAAPLV